MSWEMQYCLYLQTSKIFPMQWMLLKLPTNLACTHSGSATGKHSLHWFADRTWLLLHAYLFGCVICLPSFFLSRYIQSTCATSGEGLYEGLDWLSNNIANKVSSTLRCIQFSHTICLVLVTVFDHFLTQWPAGINVGSCFGDSWCSCGFYLAFLILVCVAVSLKFWSVIFWFLFRTPFIWLCKIRWFVSYICKILAQFLM